MSLQFTLLLLAAVGVFGTTQSGNSQAALDTKPDAPPAELVPVSSENHRFSRLLKNSANVLQFSSISNDAPPIWGVARDGKKKEAKAGKKLSLNGPNFGRRSLDYDEQLVQQGFEQTTSETRIVANPYPGNEYVYVHPGKIVETPSDTDIAASVTSINNKPPRVPLALLRQKKGKRVNISPLFTEVPQVHHDSADATKEFVWVDQPVEHRVFVHRQGRNHDSADDATTNPAFPTEDVEATTLADEPLETTTLKQNNKSKLIVNVVTSAPRFSFESSVSEGKKTHGSRPRKAHTTTVATTTTTTESTTFYTTQLPTTVPPPVLSSSSPKAIAADDKENLVTDAFHRSGTSFQGFEDSQTRLQTAESNQPARVNVRPAQNGKEYEYEYIYYYYDDDEGENGEKKGEGKGAKSNASATSTTSSAAPVSGDAPVSTVAVSSSTTTSTTTIAPELTSADADFEYEDDATFDEEPLKVSAAPELRKNTPTASRTEEEPIHKGVSSVEKLSNSNPINQLDRSRSPKSSPGKFDEAVADYKLETEASQEEEVIEKAHELSKGQPQSEDPLSEEAEEDSFDDPAPVLTEKVAEPPTSAPALSSTSGVESDQMSTLAKTHKDSVNVPIVLKQSSLLKAVPVSQLQAHHLPEETPSTAPVTVPTTTTTEAASEAIPSVRPSPQRVRGGQRLRGSVTPRAAVQTAAESAPQQPAEEKPVQPVRRPNLREGSRRIASRRPTQEPVAEAPVEPVAAAVIENQPRPLPIRPRFPPRQGSAVTAAAPVETPAPEAPAVISGAELNSLEDKKSKDAQVRSKSANDLFAFARLQQAIGSRAPSRIPPKLVGGFVNSAEATTDAISSEVTTVSALGGQSGETLISAVPSTTTTTTTTTEAPQELPGRTRGGNGPRFGGRQRKPLGGAAAGGATSTTTTEAPTTRGRFNGGRRRQSTTASPESAPTSSAGTSSTSEDAKPKIPSRNRFASRNRVSTTEASVTSEQKTAESEKPSTSQPRRRPSGSFAGRRRPNQVQGSTDAATTPEETGSTSADAAPTTASTTAAPTTPGRNRFNFAAGGRPRPGSAPAASGPAVNPVRIRGGGRLRGPTTSSTTEAAPEETKPEDAPQEPSGDAEQSQSIQSDNLEQPSQNTPAPKSVAPARGSGGVLGRLQNRPKLATTTTTPAPEGSGDRKPSRLNGILNRRKNIGHLPGGAHVKEEVKETPAEVAEEASNHAQEQDDDHKGVVVQVSSSVTESEETNAAQASEVVETPSTTPGSILNRLKSQRKPGSLFRKKPDPHGE